MDNPATPDRRKRLAGAVALLAAGALSGGILAGTLSASAADSSGGSGGSTTGNGETGTTAPRSPGQDGDGRHGGPMGGSSPMRSDERSLGSADAAKVRAAALKAVPGGTVYRVETDAGDATYEAHMTKSDGTPVTVKLDKDITVTGVEDGMGRGDPGPDGHGRHGDSGSSDGSSSGTSDGSSSGTSGGSSSGTGASAGWNGIGVDA